MHTTLRRVRVLLLPMERRAWGQGSCSLEHCACWGMEEAMQGSLQMRFSTPSPWHRAEEAVAISSPGQRLLHCLFSPHCPPAVELGEFGSQILSENQLSLSQTSCSSKDVCSKIFRSYFCSLCFCWQNKHCNWNLYLIKILRSMDFSSILWTL